MWYDKLRLMCHEYHRHHRNYVFIRHAEIYLNRKTHTRRIIPYLVYIAG